MNKTENLDFL